MKRSIFLLLASCCLSSPSIAHDFWVEPQSFQMEAPEDITVSIMIGHPEDQMYWPMNPHRVISFKSYGPAGIRDHQSSLDAQNSKGEQRLSLTTMGTHILSIETTSAKSVLAAEKFNRYVEEEGLTPIQRQRDSKNMTGKPGREIYSRRGKALIQVGTRHKCSETADHVHYYDHVTTPLGMTLEIVPNQNPYHLESQAPFEATIYYRGKPTEGVTVGLISLDTTEGVIASKVSDNTGKVVFPRPDKGDWMLHAVWSDPLEENIEAEFDTIFSSLSFGFN